MKGYGLTVFRGTAPERFDVEVVSVVPNFLLRQDIVLIRCHHPVTEKAGIIGGMSGSPIYLDGRLAGALAYGWQFQKDTLAGVTPISAMLDVLQLKERRSSKRGWRRATNAAGTLQIQNTARLSRDTGEGYFDYFRQAGDTQMVPAHTPLTLGGFVGPARKMLKQTLSHFGIDPVALGGAGGKDGATDFVPGGAIGVQFITGDMSATGIGTVTAVTGNQVLAFGHPMFNMGEGWLPVTTAEIHTVLSSLARSNKLGSPLSVKGSLVQDRQAGIMARTDRRATMIPVSVAITDARSKRKQTYKVEIANHRVLTPRFLQAALVNIIMHAASDLADVTSELTGNIKIRGHAPTTLRDSGASRTGLVGLTNYFRPVAAVAEILNNPFEDATIESMAFDISLHYGLDVAFIKGIYMTAESPGPGENINVNVRLTRYGAGEQMLTIPVRIPESAAGQKIKIEVAGGDFISPIMPSPQNLSNLIDNFSRFYPPKSLVVSVNIPAEGIGLRGRVIDRLPASAVDALLPTVGYDQISRHRAFLRKLTHTPYLVVGSETIDLTVRGVDSK